VDGAPNACVPGQPVAETCDNTDEDCSGTIDDHIANGADILEPNESCNSAYSLGNVHENNGAMGWNPKIYPAGDSDWFFFYFIEADHFCFPWEDQDFAIAVALEPPGGVDCVDYDLYLYTNDCSTMLAQSAAGGCATDIVQYTHDGECGSNDSRGFVVEVRPYGAVWECVPYMLYIDAWLL
jgi:hypothetical protein